MLLCANRVNYFSHQSIIFDANLVHEKNEWVIYFEFKSGKSGIQTHGTDKPFTGFRVRPIRSLWHLSFIGSEYTDFSYPLSSSTADFL